MLPDTLQTSPYLTRIDPGTDPPVTYWTDTFGAAYPEGDAPAADTVFGIVGLDRRIVWESNREMLDLLRACARAPRAAHHLAGLYGADRVAAATTRNWLQAPGQLCRDYRLVSGEIEVTAHCNWGCRFCPVATDPKPRQTMPMDLFKEIAAKLGEVSTIDYVTFQFFNEPTLDKHFIQRVEVLARHGMQLALYTNASALSQDKIDALRHHGVLRHLIVNMPSADPEEFAQLTGSRSYRHTVHNLGQAIDAGFRVQVVVNGVGERLVRNLDTVNRLYRPLGVEVYPSMTCDRAGDVGGDYAQEVRVEGRLNGCGWPVQHANISVRGDLFLCCNDYYQREVFGNIRDGSIHDLMTSEAAVRLRRRVFGVDDAPDDFLCRRCHNQLCDFPGRDFRPIATFG
ncbi:radical SAM protein (plasmid) [Streptomyces sp. HU2014]|uniref:radical SAM/SPASM domain-containing protein n=1 Tax=Streptomyces sp. HU2014 TaxID=2939414 RepID=UPI00200E839E|nr:radical SAM/SPASM domain-containing protein [Streptomyces sp. HU2014]UQI49679.1 radical SAM protein [Streptomyces sp. HU2014]